MPAPDMALGTTTAKRNAIALHGNYTKHFKLRMKIANYPNGAAFDAVATFQTDLDANIIANQYLHGHALQSAILATWWPSSDHYWRVDGKNP